MFNFDYIKKEMKEHNPKWPDIPDHPYRILMIGGSGSGKTNALLNLINHKLNIDKFDLHAKDPYDAKYQFLTNKQESTGLNNLYYSKGSIKYLNDMGDIYRNFEEYNPNKKRKTLIVMMIWLLIQLVIKKLNPIVNELFIRRRKLNVSLVFIIQSYFAIPKNIRLNSTDYLVMRIPDKRELQQIAFNHLSHNDFKDFMNLCKKCTEKPYFLIIDTNLASESSSRFRKNLLETI